MNYVTTQTDSIIIEHVVSTISSYLRSGKYVTWLLSGGSAIDLEVRIAQALQTHDVTRLYIGLIDERYGPTGHKDENYTQLMDAHFPLFIHRILASRSAKKTTEAFGESIAEALQKADYSLGIFGIGADGHTAGIKPHSPAVLATTPAMFYEWDDYERITLTPKTIGLLDEAIIYAAGSEKANTLRSLLQGSASIDEQPAQVLKTIKTATLYTDNVL